MANAALQDDLLIMYDTRHDDSDDDHDDDGNVTTQVICAMMG